jgi:hypothetical protein
MGWTEEQARKLAAVSITQAAYNVQAAMMEQVNKKLKNPKDIVTRRAFLVHQAKIQGDTITPAMVSVNTASRGKGGISAAHILRSLILSGTRRDRRSEDALDGTMGPGKAQWRPGAKAPVDAGGDLSGAYIRKVLSALHAKQYEGSTSRTAIKGTTRLTNRRLAAMNKRSGVVLNRRTGDIQKGLRGYEPEQVSRFLASKAGQQSANFMVGNAKGKSKKGTIVYQFDWQVAKGKKTPNNINPRDVLKKANLKPVLVFTRQQQYRKLIPFYEIAAKVSVTDMPKIVETKGRALMEKWGAR